jgi:hypothetical protein
MQAIPGVTSAAYSRYIPLTTQSGSSNGGEHYLGAQTSLTHIDWNEGRVGPSYSETMGIRLVQGREFAASDRSGAPNVAIVNEEFARKYFAGQGAVGKTIRFAWRQHAARRHRRRRGEQQTLVAR